VRGPALSHFPELGAGPEQAMRVDPSRTIRAWNATLPAMISHRAQTIPIDILALVTAALAFASGRSPGDIRLARWLQAHPIPFADPLTDFTNDYLSGTPLTVAGIALATALLAARRTEAALLIVLATALRSTNSLLKALFDSPRPTPDLIHVTEQAPGPGFPSGHAMGALLLLGALASLLWTRAAPSGSPRGPWPRDAVRLLRRMATVVCVALILLTGYGRIHTGAHWPSDVLGGYLWGTALLALAIRVVGLVAGRPSPRGTRAARGWNGRHR